MAGTAAPRPGAWPAPARPAGPGEPRASSAPTPAPLAGLVSSGRPAPEHRRRRQCWRRLQSRERRPACQPPPPPGCASAAGRGAKARRGRGGGGGGGGGEEEAREEEEEEVVGEESKARRSKPCGQRSCGGAGGQGREGGREEGSRREAWGTERRGGSAGASVAAPRPPPLRALARTHSLARPPAPRSRACSAKGACRLRSPPRRVEAAERAGGARHGQAGRGEDRGALGASAAQPGARGSTWPRRGVLGRRTEAGRPLRGALARPLSPRPCPRRPRAAGIVWLGGRGV